LPASTAYTSDKQDLRQTLSPQKLPKPACEFAWLWARIREPNIFAQGEFTLSQTFFRPMLGVTLIF